jgi:predicted S18 family serine protease
LKIQGIESVENEPDKKSLFDSFMDIEIAKNGNVTVTIINPFDKEEIKARQLSFLFKTAENGGRFPLVATAFTRATERAAAAKRF